jgi:hypothetical protein
MKTITAGEVMTGFVAAEPSDTLGEIAEKMKILFALASSRSDRFTGQAQSPGSRGPAPSARSPGQEGRGRALVRLMLPRPRSLFPLT